MSEVKIIESKAPHTMSEEERRKLDLWATPKTFNKYEPVRDVHQDMLDVKKMHFTWQELSRMRVIHFFCFEFLFYFLN